MNFHKIKILLFFINCFGLTLMMMLKVELDEKNFDQIIDCTVQLIDKLLNSSTDSVKIYINSTQISSTNNAVLLEKKLFDVNKVVIFSTSDYHRNAMPIIGRKLYVAFVSEIMELEMILKFFYQEITHKHFIICVTFTSVNMLDDIYNISSKVWIDGIPRNVIFVVSKQRNNNNPFVIGVSGYRKNCNALSFDHVSI